MTPIVFTDLDGSLLDRDTYSWEPARPALERLKRHRIPWILVTSKTRAEVELWRRLLGNTHPFVVENGGAAYVPGGYFPMPIPGALPRDGYDVVEWGARYEDLVAGLEDASRASGCRSVGFHQMTAEEVAAACDLPIEQARLAKQREYDEPFQIVDHDRTGQLLAAISEQGLRWVQGGRFYHVCGNNDKSRAIKLLRDLFERVRGHVITIALGDGLNDAPLLNAADIPIIVRSPSAAALARRVPGGILTECQGPEGWNEALAGKLRDLGISSAREG
jgi:mannosyl-3-phosphoglycerate phosphatase